MSGPGRRNQTAQPEEGVRWRPYYGSFIIICETTTSMGGPTGGEDGGQPAAAGE